MNTTELISKWMKTILNFPDYRMNSFAFQKSEADDLRFFISIYQDYHTAGIGLEVKIDKIELFLDHGAYSGKKMPILDMEALIRMSQIVELMMSELSKDDENASNGNFINNYRNQSRIDKNVPFQKTKDEFGTLTLRFFKGDEALQEFNKNVHQPKESAQAK